MNQQIQEKVLNDVTKVPVIGSGAGHPFSISKEEAIQAFKKWCKNGRLRPNRFMTEIGQGDNRDVCTLLLNIYC